MPANGRVIASGKLAAAALAEIYNARGRHYDDVGRYDPALTDLDQAIRRDPKLVAAYYNRADAHVGLHELRQAFDDYSAAVHLDPKYVVAASTAALDSGSLAGEARALAYAVRANGFMAQRDYDRAIANLTEEIRADPEDAGAYGQRGEAWADKGEDDKAIADFSAAIALDPMDATDLDNRGEVYHHRKHDLDRAVADYSVAIAVDPKSAAALGDRGDAYLDKGNYDFALADYDAAIRLRPTAGGFHTAKAEALLAKNDAAAALAEANEGVRLRPDDDAYAVRGDVSRRLHRPKEAAADYNKALSIDRNNKTAATEKADSRQSHSALI